MTWNKPHRWAVFSCERVKTWIWGGCAFRNEMQNFHGPRLRLPQCGGISPHTPRYANCPKELRDMVVQIDGLYVEIQVWHQTFGPRSLTKRRKPALAPHLESHLKLLMWVRTRPIYRCTDLCSGWCGWSAHIGCHGMRLKQHTWTRVSECFEANGANGPTDNIDQTWVCYNEGHMNSYRLTWLF